MKFPWLSNRPLPNAANNSAQSQFYPGLVGQSQAIAGAASMQAGIAGIANMPHHGSLGHMQQQQMYGGPLGAQQAGAAFGNAMYPPLPQFEENVPEDELEYSGRLDRWPYQNMLGGAITQQYGLGLYKPQHTIANCQRMLML